MWAQHIHNVKAVYGTFGDNVPELKGLSFGQLLVNPVGAVALSLNLEKLPEGSPLRWPREGYDRLQFRVRFILITDLTIQKRNQAAGCESRFELEIRKDFARLSGSNSTFEFTCKFEQAYVEFYPFRSKGRVDRLEDWYK
jgi:Immunity protein 50